MLLSPEFLAKRREKKTIRAKAPVAFQRRILNERNHDPNKQINVQEIISRILALAQALSEKKFYPYQISLARRLVESLLLHDGAVITGLMARQLGKTEILASICAALCLILPHLAKQFPQSWHLNITDDYGTYRGFVFGIKIGIYAPRLLQSEIMFERVRKCFETKTAKQILKEMRIHAEVSNGCRLILNNGSVTLCDSASEQSKIEGETHNLLIVEEAQDVGDTKVKKSLHPMVSSTMGTIAKIGTATTFKCDFYTSIKTNERMELVTKVKNHFFFPYTIGEKYNSLYRKYIEQEKIRLGEDSDEFQTSYCGAWIFERGMFVTSQQLFDVEVSLDSGLFSEIYLKGLPEQYSYYSLVAGIDWGSSNDSTVVTLTAVNWAAPLQSGEYHVGNRLDSFVFYKKHILGWIEYRGDNYEVQYWALFEYFKMLSKRGLRKIVMDSNTCGKPIFDRFQASMKPYNVEVVSFNFSPKVKSDGYKFYYSDICGHRVTFPAGSSARKTREYRNFAFQMLDLKKEYHLGLMQVAHPDEKGAHDDFCWVAGTKVLTSEGERAIETIKEGDLLVTRKGLCPVVATGNREAEVISRFGMTGTPDHPFITTEGIKRFDNLCNSDTLHVWNEKRLCIEEKNIIGILNQNEDSYVFTSGDTTNGKLLPCLYIVKSILTSMVQFLKIGLFTTGTIIRSIINFPILQLDQGVNTCPNIVGTQKCENKFWKILEKHTQKKTNKKQETGIALRLVENGTENMLMRAYRKAVVYNLQVANVHEYFANGVLVHNCDSVMMAVLGANEPAHTNDIDFLDKNIFIR